MIVAQTCPSKIKQDEFLNMLKFVVTENFKHHTDEEFSNDYKKYIASIYREEMGYLNDSQIFTVKNEEGEMMGMIRSLKWDYINQLPIQKIFGIDLFVCINGHSINEIWHIGRFAIKKEVRDIILLKKLMVCAIKPICVHKDNIAFAECDAKLLRIMALMGIKTKIVGESIDYLGSKAIPVCMYYDGLINFYNENKHLVE